MSRPARPEVLALLDDVKANPADLTPWLVLCDWLEENGDEADQARSEYCRLCFDKLGKKTNASDWEKGERRRQLYRTWKHAWFGPLLELPMTMEKGLAIIPYWEMPRGHWPRLLAVVEPWAWVPALHFGCDDEDLEAIASSPALRVLRHLDLTCHRISLPIARAFVQSPHMGPHLRFRLNVTYPASLTPEIRRLLRGRFPGVFSW